MPLAAGLEARTRRAAFRTSTSSLMAARGSIIRALAVSRLARGSAPASTARPMVRRSCANRWATPTAFADSAPSSSRGRGSSSLHGVSPGVTAPGATTFRRVAPSPGRDGSSGDRVRGVAQPDGSRCLRARHRRSAGPDGSFLLPSRDPESRATCGSRSGRSSRGAVRRWSRCHVAGRQPRNPLCNDRTL